MKRKLAALMVGCLVTNSTMPAFAGTEVQMPSFLYNLENANVKATESTADKATNSDADHVEIIATTTDAQVEVKIYNFLPNDRMPEFEVRLEPIGKTKRNNDMIGEISGFMSLENNVNSLDLFADQAGEYKLTVTPVSQENGAYLPYEQNIKIESNSTVTISLANDNPALYGYENSADKFGKLVMGNFETGDYETERVNDKDQKTLTDAIYNQSDDLLFDLNGDGVVSLIDLSYFTRFYKNPVYTSRSNGYIWANDSKLRGQTSTKRNLTEESIKEVEIASNSNAKEEDVKALFTSTNENTTGIESANGEMISAENPVEIATSFTEPVQMGAVVIEPEMGSENAMMDGEVEIVTEDGSKYTAVVENGVVTQIKKDGIAGAVEAGLRRAFMRSIKTDAMQANSIVIDLGKQIPVKKITIRVTRTMVESSLAEIAKVEFLNNAEDHIPLPQLNTPEWISAEAGDQSMSLKWTKQANVTGYEVEISQNGKRETQIVDTNSIEIERFLNDDLVNNTEYTVTVRSVNGSWKSPVSVEKVLTPKPASRPIAPLGIAIKGGYKSLTVTWDKGKNNATSYTIYYREKALENAPYEKVENITGTSYTIQGLKDVTSYDVYMTASNELGESDPSIHYTGTTVSVNAPATPNYKLINYPQEEGLTEHIEAAWVNNGGAELAVDGVYETSWIKNDWDAGVFYPGNGKSPMITFDDTYEMNTIVVIPSHDNPPGLSKAVLTVWNEDGEQRNVDGRFIAMLDKNGKKYYQFRSNEPFAAKKLQLSVTTGYDKLIKIAEMKFYYYDSLMDEVNAIFADGFHLSLRQEVNEQTISDLRERLEYVDERSKEKNPDYEIIKKELDFAEEILNNGSKAAEIIEVNNHLTVNRDSHISFRGGLNTWQPLGITANTGDKITVYVGAENKEQGASTNLKLVTTQYHAEYKNFMQEISGLKVGMNEITIPALTEMDVEKGGQLYIVYTGKDGAENYAVRVAGGTKVPMLNLYGITDEAERNERLINYVKELESYDPEKIHNQEHKNLAYDEKNCIAGATDLAGQRAMLSVSVEQVLKGLGSGSVEEKAKKLGDSMQAMDEMLYLMYQHKGLSEASDAGWKHKMPASRINIRYHRMFEGAFMYAGGSHIGIEWDSIPDMVTAVPVTADENGKYISGNYFGWGIAHEVGHEINEGAYAIKEVTNNYFSQLSVAQDSNSSVRFGYDDVYKKVTSGTVGKAADIFTQLAMYWQLHLAYDKDYNYKTYDTYKEQFNGLFFARVDSFVREPAMAPAPGGITLSLNTDSDNKLMRLSVAAAQKNILPFFERWGWVPNAETIRYASQFGNETRGIWLANDDQRVYAIEHQPTNQVNEEGILQNVNVDAVLSYNENGSENNKVKISGIKSNGNDMFGYEIFRTERQKSKVIRRSVGFISADQDSFTDEILSVNNRAFEYDIVGYDMWLNPTKAVQLGSVRVSHDGNLSKENWEVTTNMVSLEDGTDNDTPDALVKKAIGQVIDQNAKTTYVGKTADARTVPEIVIHMNEATALTGLIYEVADGDAISKFDVYVSDNGTDWTKVEKENAAFDLQEQNGVRTQKILFTSDVDGVKILETYEASYLKITAPGQGGKDLAISEMTLIGQTGDKVNLDQIGVLAQDYVQNGVIVIPQGSVVFTGTYAGNPAYNAVRVFDEEGYDVGSVDEDGIIYAEQLILAPKPEDGDLRNIANGHWLYYITPDENQTLNLPKKVRVELYRVDDASTLKGERLVSSTEFKDLNAKTVEDLPKITLTYEN